MTLAVIQYIAGGRHLGQVALKPTNPLPADQRSLVLRRLLLAVAAVVVLAVLAGFLGLFSVDNVVNALTVVILVVAVVYFARILLDRRLTDTERSRMRAYLYLFVMAAAFWLIYDQAGSVLTQFARDDTDRTIGSFTFPASWLLAVNPIFIIIGAPAFAALWLRLGTRLSTPVKFSIGLILNGLSFVLMSGAAAIAASRGTASWLWLVAVYAIQVAGELSLSPVGLSVTTKLAPAVYASQMMGLWFLATAVGDALGGQVARLTTSTPLTGYFLVSGLASVVLGLSALGFTRRIRSLMRGIH